MNKSNKTPPNTLALQALEDKGYVVKIQHYRKVVDWDSFSSKEEIIVPDPVWRRNKMQYGEPNIHGGKTELTIIRGEEKITVAALCSDKDNFSRRLGVRIALGRLEKLLNIK